MDSNLPRWSVRLDATRPSDQPGFSDLLSLVSHHYKLHEKAANFLGPYNSKQRNRDHYTPPLKETLRQLIPQGRVNDFTYFAYINSLIRYCEQTKGNRALPTPHPSVVHSIQLPLPAFELHTGGQGDIMVQIIGIEAPLVVKGLRNPDEVKFIIVRPKLSKLGTASASSWEVLFYRQNQGYIPDWADTTLNPRYAGIM